MFLLLVFSAWQAFAQGSGNALPPLAPAFPEMTPSFWELHQTAILIGVAVLLALVSVILWLALRTKPQPVPPPELVASRALDKLEHQPEDGMVLSEVSRILRRYVLAAFALPGGELTTAEFYTVLAQTRAINLDLGESISRFLRDCDELKFAPVKSGEPFNAVARARELVAQAQRSAPERGGVGNTP